MTTFPNRLGAWVSVAASFLLIACGESPLEVPAVLVPSPALDLPGPSDGAIQTVYLAGGCFWGVEAVFEHVKGVESVVSGYAGGTAESATYTAVSTGTTGHAETVGIRYDPRRISYGKILQIFFSVGHDPTQVNAQYPDYGPQYRSNIFYSSDTERDVARAFIDQINASGVLPFPVATRLDPLGAFYLAEDHHQDYLVHHTDELYIITYDLPKVDNLRRLFPELYRDS